MVNEDKRCLIWVRLAANNRILNKALNFNTMRYHNGQKVWVWRLGDVEEEPQEATITSFSGKASFDEDVYEFDYLNGGSSGAGESDIFETLKAAEYARFKCARLIIGIFAQIEKISVNNCSYYDEIKHKMASASR